MCGRLGQLQGGEDALNLLVSVERLSIGSCYVALLGLTGSAATLRRAVVGAGGTGVGPPSSVDVANRYLAHRGIGGRLGHSRVRRTRSICW